MWWRAYGPRTVGVRGLVVDDDGAVLLVRHSYGPDTWHLPGGGVKRRESLAQAVLRELSEEVGLRVEGGDSSLDLFGAYSNLQEGKSDHITVFVVRGWTRREVDPAEITAAAFFPPDALPANTSPGTRRRIEEFARARKRSFEW